MNDISFLGKTTLQFDSCGMPDFPEYQNITGKYDKAEPNVITIPSENDYFKNAYHYVNNYLN